MHDSSAYAHYPQSLSGGAAFPKPCCESHNGEEGMSLRDYFAGQAMAAMITTAAAPAIVGGLSGAESNCAAAAYMMADAMINERNVT